jgi:type I restriction enzyme M protein
MIRKQSPKTSVSARLKKIQDDTEYKEEIAILEKYLELSEEEAGFNREIKSSTEELSKLVEQKYNELTVENIKTLVVEKKWYGYLNELCPGGNRTSGAKAYRKSIRTFGTL